MSVVLLVCVYGVTGVSLCITCVCLQYRLCIFGFWLGGVLVGNDEQIQGVVEQAIVSLLP